MGRGHRAERGRTAVRSASEMTARFLALALFATAGCAEFPQDPDGTADRVRAERAFRVGLISGDAGAEASAQSYLARVGATAGARALIERGAAEPLLAKLRDGGLDLVIGPMSPKSPWEHEVHFLPALQERVGREDYVRIVPMAPHGENRWIALLDKAARDSAGGA